MEKRLITKQDSAALVKALSDIIITMLLYPEYRNGPEREDFECPEDHDRLEQLTDQMEEWVKK